MPAVLEYWLNLDRRNAMDKETEVRLSLVEQSYQNLEKRIDKVEEKLDSLRDEMKNGQHSLTKVIIGAAGTIVAGLLSTIVVIITQL